MEPDAIIKVKTVLKVTTDAETSIYQVHADEGSSVNEMAFAVSVVIKTLIRDGHIKTRHDFMKLVNKYCTDTQYDEVKIDE